MSQEEHHQFEKAFERLEKILDRMNQGGVSLDESLRLYEEADQLIVTCHCKLTQAEEKVEKLIKNRENRVLLDKNQMPVKEPFEAEEATCHIQ